MDESILESTFKKLNKTYDKVESLIDQVNKLNTENVRLRNELKSMPNKVDDDTEKQDDVPTSPLYKALTGKIGYNKKRYQNIIFNALEEKEQDIQKFLLESCTDLTDNIIKIKIMRFWELKEIQSNKTDITIGADQGYNDTLTLSNGQITPNKDIHSHTLKSIINKVSKKKKGSKAFKRAKAHQKNFINWSINQLNFSNIKQLNFEKIRNMNYKSGTSRKMSHWQNTLIRDKVEDYCIQNGVRFVQQSAIYRSQRCSSCGQVRKANRKGKIYSCKNCGLKIDSDLNAAKNHELELPEIPWTLRKLNLNRKGFFWKPDGFKDLEGRSIQSLPLVED